MPQMGKLASGPRQEPFTSVVPVSVAHLCVSYTPTVPLKVVNFFSVGKLFKTRVEMCSNQHSCDLFSKEIMQFCTGEEGCPLPNALVGTMLRFDFEMQTPNFHTARMEGASQRDLTVRWNRLWIFILIQLQSASQLSTFAHFAVLERHRVKFRVQNATAGDGDGDDD